MNEHDFLMFLDMIDTLLSGLLVVFIQLGDLFGLL